MENQDEMLKRAQSIQQAIEYMESIDAGKAYEKGIAKIRCRRRNAFTHNMMRVAAAMALPLFVACAILSALYFFPRQSRQTAQVTAPRGAVVRYELPDNSTVWLNSASTLTYPVRFDSKARRVTIEGEAYFEVSADPKKPFYVNTADGPSVKVYGTSFNVSAYPDDDFVSATLETGHIDFIVSDNQYLSLAPGEQARYNRLTGELVRSQVNTYEHSAWKEGRLVLRNANLSEVFKALERKFGVTIKVSGKVDENETYRATFRDESISQILDYLSRTAEFGWKYYDGAQAGGDPTPGKVVCIEMKK